MAAAKVVQQRRIGLVDIGEPGPLRGRRTDPLFQTEGIRQGAGRDSGNQHGSGGQQHTRGCGTAQPAEVTYPPWQGCLDGLDQVLCIAMEALAAYFQRIALHQRSQFIGQVVLARHPGAVDQDRNDVHIVAANRGCNLDPYEIGRVVDTAIATLVAYGQPPGADDGQKHVALRDLLIELVREVLARLDVVDVDKDASRR